MAWIVYYLTILLISRFTFKSDGFYKTLQRKAAKILKETGTGPDWSSSIFQDFLTLSFLICFVFLCYYPLLTTAVIAGMQINLSIYICVCRCIPRPPILKPSTFQRNIVKPWPQTLSPKTPNPKTKGPWAYTKILWALTPTNHPITFKHEGGVSQKNSKSKKGSE